MTSVNVAITEVLLHAVLSGLVVTCVFVTCSQLSFQAIVIFLVIVVIKVQNWLHKGVHVRLIGPLFLQAVTVVITKVFEIVEHPNRLLRLFIIVVVKHTQEATFIFLLELFASAKVPRAELNPRFEVTRRKLCPLSIVLELLL